MTIDLNGIWKLADFDPGTGERGGAQAWEFDDQAWLDAAVPGNVHSTLAQIGRIPPPFYDQNLEACQWIEEREWWYRRTFEYVASEMPDERQTLVFDGLDTLCTIYLNGELLGRNENMFIPARFDVTQRLKPGRNGVALRFDPILLSIGAREVPGQWTRRAPVRALVRKAQYHFGWDWGPRVLTVGPWRGVRIETAHVAHIAGVHFTTRLITAERDRAEAAVEVEIKCLSAHEAEVAKTYAALEIEIGLARGAQRQRVLTSIYEDGRARAAFSIPFPELWWTHDLGDPALYDLEVTLLHQKETLDSYRSRVGLRTLSWDQSPDPDEPGTRFFAPVLNGIRIFARGANWIPADSFLSEVDEARFREWLELAAEADMNMLRVWGGGIYEHPALYDLCDELGILIWQDFLYACALYPDGDPAFAADAEREARAAVRRLRNHASLALWCGNNENDWLDDLRNWTDPGRDFPGKRLYHDILPRVINELDSDKFYWPSSPYGGNDHNDASQGDRHNWQVWHGSVYPRVFGQRPEVLFTPEGVSYHHYSEDTGRFISEFGIHAAPVLETLRRNIPNDQLTLGSEGLLYRNKDNPKDKGKHLMQAHTGEPRNLEQYIDFSMITQAEGLKLGIEHYRRRKPHCSGTLVWQLNDCWPGISWSLVDYYRFPKAGYFYVKRAYAPVSASFKSVADGFELWVVNDTLKSFSDQVTFGQGRFSGERLYEEKVEIGIPPNSARRVTHIQRERILDLPSESYLYVHAARSSLPSNRWFLTEIKDLHWPVPRFEVTKQSISDHEIEIQLSSEKFLYFLKLECPIDGTRYSDNYFDLFPGSRVVVRVWNALGRAIQPDDIAVSTLAV